MTQSAKGWLAVALVIAVVGGGVAVWAAVDAGLRVSFSDDTPTTASYCGVRICEQEAWSLLYERLALNCPFYVRLYLSGTQPKSFTSPYNYGYFLEPDGAVFHVDKETGIISSPSPLGLQLLNGLHRICERR